jgi:hypothetical protein
MHLAMLTCSNARAFARHAARLFEGARAVSRETPVAVGASSSLPTRIGQCHASVTPGCSRRGLVRVTDIGDTAASAKPCACSSSPLGCRRRFVPTTAHRLSPEAPAALGEPSAWWLKLGIRHERIERGNRPHERMHLTLKLETAMPPSSSMRAQQRAFDRFRARHDRGCSLGCLPCRTLVAALDVWAPRHLGDDRSQYLQR